MKRCYVSIIVASLGSFFLSAYLALKHYSFIMGGTGTEALCSLVGSGNCELVNASQYSAIASIALGSFGAAIDACLIVLAWFAWRNVYYRQVALYLMGLTAVLLALATTYLIYVSSALLGAFCQLCVITYILHAISIVAIVLLIVVYKQLKFEHIKSIPKDHWKKFAGIFVFICVLVFAADRGAYYTYVGKSQKQVKSFIDRYKKIAQQDFDLSFMPSKGAKNPKLSIVTFGDFLCPYCKRSATYNELLLARFPDHVRLHYAHFPFDSECNAQVQNSGHAGACLSAAASLCAQKQGYFWNFHDALFEQQTHLQSLSSASQRKAAMQQLFDGLLSDKRMDSAAYQSCMQDMHYSSTLQRHLQMAQRISLSGTPTYIFNGRVVSGLLPPHVLTRIVELELAE